MKVTLLITTFDRGALLRNSLNRLCALTPPDELLIVDDGSGDDTEQVARDFADRLPVRYLYNHQPQRGLCSLARNIGVRHAAHDWIVTSEPELVFLTDVIAQFRDLEPQWPGDIISAGTISFANAGWDQFDQAPGGVQQAIGWVATYTALWHRSWLAQIGGWDETFPGPWGWDDTDVLTRLRLAGHGQHRALDVHAVHQYHGLGADNQAANEAHFRAKSFHGDETRTDDLVANRDREWGTIIPRS